MFWGLNPKIYPKTRRGFTRAGFKSHHQDTLERFALEGKSDSEDDSDDSGDEADAGDVPEAEERPAGSKPEVDADAETAAGEAAACSPPAAEEQPPASASEGADVPGSSPVAPPAASAAQSAVAEAADRLAAVQLDERPEQGTGTGGGSEEDDAISTWSEAPSTALADAPHVQRRVTAQRQNAVRRGALAHASRNAQKAKSKKSRDSLSASMQF